MAVHALCVIRLGFEGLDLGAPCYAILLLPFRLKKS